MEGIYIGLGLLFSPAAIILGLLFYDQRKTPQRAIIYTLLFLAFLILGILLIFQYGVYVVVIAPLLIWAYFFYMFLTKNSHNEKNG